MTDLTIKNEMIDTLASMKGKILKTIEGRYDFVNKTFLEIIRFNFSQFAVEIISDYDTVIWSIGSDCAFQDEVTRFTVLKRNSSEKRIYPEGCEAVRLIKNEIISEVMIVRDGITTEKGDDVLIDSGIVLKTKQKVYTFSRVDLSGMWFHMNESDRIEMYYTVKDIKKDCLDNAEGNRVVVKRDYVFL